MSQAILIRPSKKLVFEPDSWLPDIDNNRTYPSNCLSYALNCKSLGFPFWDSFTNAAGRKPTCLQEFRDKVSAIMPPHERPLFSLIETPFNVLTKAAFAGLQNINAEEAETGYLRGEHVIAFSCSFQHFFRKDADGRWTHKLGSRPPVDHDDNGSEIFSLEKAFFKCMQTNSEDKRYYNKLLYFRIPETGIRIEPVLPK